MTRLSEILGSAASVLGSGNVPTVLLGTSMLGVAAGVTGVFALFRGRALLGDAVAHAALPGVCLAYFAAGERNFSGFLAGAFVTGLFGAWTVSAVSRVSRVKPDAATAIVLGSFFGAGLVLSRLIQNRPSGNRAGLDGFIFGKAAAMVRGDALSAAVVAAACVAGVVLLYKEFKLLAFDPGFAAAAGLPVAALDRILTFLLCLCAVTGLPVAGAVLTSALLVIPPAAARLWSDSFPVVLLVAAVVGVVSAAAGTVMSAVLPDGLPTGPLIVLCAAGIFAVSLVAAPRHGLVARYVRRRVGGRGPTPAAGSEP